jgi:hypothetical protein
MIRIIKHRLCWPKKNKNNIININLTFMYRMCVYMRFLFFLCLALFLLPPFAACLSFSLCKLIYLTKTTKKKGNSLRRFLSTITDISFVSLLLFFSGNYNLFFSFSILSISLSLSLNIVSTNIILDFDLKIFFKVPSC